MPFLDWLLRKADLGAAVGLCNAWSREACRLYSLLRWPFEVAIPKVPDRRPAEGLAAGREKRNCQACFELREEYSSSAESSWPSVSEAIPSTHD